MSSPRHSVLSRERVTLTAQFVVLITLLSVVPQKNASAETPVGGDITVNTTWTPAGSPYVGSVTVKPGVRLTVQPGVVVKSYDGIEVQGVLEAVGTPEQPIFFTSIHDDTVGGDTDGETVAPAPADWGGITFGSESGGSMQHCVVRYGGGWARALHVSSSAQIANCTIEQNLGDGLLAEGDGAPPISNCTFRKNSGYGLNVSSTGYHGSGQTGLISDNTITGNDYAATFSWQAAEQIAGTGWQVEGNGKGDVPWANALEVRMFDIPSGDTAHLPTSPPGTAYLACEWSVVDGATLTIAPGAIIKLPHSREVWVAGTLIAQGTAEQPIYFTSVYDDSVGGDADGGSTSPAWDWEGLVFGPGSGGTVQHCMVRYAGGGTVAPLQVETSLTIAYCTVENSRGGLYVTGGGSPTIENCTFSNNQDDGLLADGDGTPVIRGCSFYGNTGYGLNVTSTGYHGSGKTGLISDNTITDNSSAAHFGWEAAEQLAGSAWQVEGNDSNSLDVDVSIPTGYSAHLPASPAGTSYATWDQLRVAQGATLTIDPGTVLKFGEYGTAPLDGTLNAVGTAEQPIYFTSIHDDSVGGDTDGTSAAPGSGDWGGITFGSESGGSMQHCVVRYGGAWATALHVSSSAQIANCTIEQNLGDGLLAEGDGAPPISNCTFRNNSGYGLNVSSTGYHGSGQSGLISDNTVTGNDYAAAFSWQAAEQLAGVWQVSDNGSDGLEVDLDIPTGFSAQLPASPAGTCYTSSGATIPQGATLTVAPGALIKSGQYARIDVSGTFNAIGVAEQPVIFTSLGDDTLGGDTNGDGDTTTPFRGDWGGIVFNADALGTLEHCLVRYAGGEWSDAIDIHSSPTISQTTVEQSAQGGLSAWDNGAPTVQNCTFRNNMGNGLSVWSTGYPGIGETGLLSDNVCTGNGGSGVALSLEASAQLAGSAWEVSDNGTDGFDLGYCGLAGGTEVELPTAPAGCTYVVDGIDVDAGATLALSPGVLMKFREGGYLAATGRLDAFGTPEHPVIFTSIYDDSVGGDTNADHGVTAPYRGAWGSVSFVAGSSGAMQHCTARYGGAGWGWDPATFEVNGTCTVSDCAVEQSSSDGLRAGDGADLMLARGHIADNAGSGVVLEGTALATLTGNRVSANVGDGVSVNGDAEVNLGNLTNADAADDGGNMLWGNGGYAVSNQSPQTVFAQNNYWGTLDHSQIDAMIYDFGDDDWVGVVRYLPLSSISALPFGLASVEANGPWPFQVSAVSVLGEGRFAEGATVTLIGPAGERTPTSSVSLGPDGLSLSGRADFAGVSSGWYGLEIVNGDGSLVTLRDVVEVVPPEAPSITRVTPKRGVAGETVSLTIEGRHLNPFAAAQLQNGGGGGTGATGSGNGRADGTDLTVALDLTDQTPGVWDVVVTNGNGQTTQMDDALEVLSSGEPHIWTSVVGPGNVSAGRPATYQVWVGNSGTSAAAVVAVEVEVPAEFQVEAVIDDTGAALELTEDERLPGEAPLVVLIRDLGVDQQRMLTLQLTPLAADVGAGSAASAASGDPEPQVVVTSAVLLAAGKTILISEAIDLGTDVLVALLENPDMTTSGKIRTGFQNHLNEWTSHPWQKAGMLALGGFLRGGLEAANSAGLVPNTYDLLNTALKRNRWIKPVVELWYATIGWDVENWLHVQIVTSWDPNIKYGPPGFGDQRYVQSGQPMAYTVQFENDPQKATAAAAQVVVTDQLDADLDWSTFRLTTVDVAGVSVPVPPSSQSFTTSVAATVKLKDLNDPAYPNCEPLPTNISIDVTCSFDPQTGRAEWRFVGRDPVTGELADFLPPNEYEDNPDTAWDDVVGPQGEGAIIYSCNLRPGIATGATIENRARITFDTNPPLDTNTTLHTIDAAAPSSAAAPLAAQVGSQFVVKWTGQDDEGGAGVGGYDVYVSDDGGPYQAWQTNTVETEAHYEGLVGHAYRFYSRARDNSGNVEAAPAGEAPDATTSVVPSQTASFPAGMSMVSVPVSPVDGDPAALGFQTSRWARWDTADGAYVYYGSDTQRYTWFDAPGGAVGKGYWACFEQQASIGVVGAVADDASECVVAIDPGPAGGWVQIGGPRLVDVPWLTAGAGSIRVRRQAQELPLAEAAAAGWCEDFAWGYTPGSGYDLVRDPADYPVAGRDALQPWQGYWMKFNGPCDLVFPSVAAAAGAAGGREAVTLGPGGWSLTLHAGADNGAASSVIVGQAGESRQIAAPPPFVEFVQATIADADSQLGVDLRRPGNGDAWAVDVETDLGKQEITLTWPDLSGLPGGLRPALTDTETGKRTYMRTSTGYTFTSAAGGETRRFMLEMVPPGSSTAATATVLAAQTKGGQVDIRVNLTAAAAVDIAVLNIAGREVANVCNGHACEQGITTLTFSGVGSHGTRLPSGRYLVRARAYTDDGQQTHAMTAFTLER